MKLLLLLIPFYLLGCGKEYSCEGQGCRDTFFIPPLKQPIRWPPRDSLDTTRNDLIGQYHFYVADNSKVKKIYINFQTVRYIPGHFQIIDSILVQNTPDGYYNSFIDFKTYKLGAGIQNLGRIYYDSCFQKSDTFRYFIEIRYKNAEFLRSDTVTLVL